MIKIKKKIFFIIKAASALVIFLTLVLFVYAAFFFNTSPIERKAAKNEIAKPLYELFVKYLKKTHITVKTGKFGEHMEIQLINEGPVTIILESKNGSTN